MILGIAGKACSGKNAAADYFKSRGFVVVDVDKLGHQALLENQTEVVNLFGEKILDINKKIDRTKLGVIVFRNREMLKQLENIIHPAVFIMVEKIISESSDKKLIINSALLGLSGMDTLCDKVLWIETPLFIRIKRAFRRDRGKISHIFSRIRSQLTLTVQHFSAVVDIYMVRNRGSLKDLEKQIDNFLSTPEDYKRV